MVYTGLYVYTTYKNADFGACLWHCFTHIRSSSDNSSGDVIIATKIVAHDFSRGY